MFACVKEVSSSMEHLPGSTRVVDEHVKSVGELLRSGNEDVTAGFVFEIGNDVFTFAWTELIESVGRLFKLGLLATGNDHLGAVLHKCLGRHLA